MGEFVRVLIKDSFSRFLVLNQGTNRSPSWNFPGGKVEPGETFEAAAIRETLEETGIEIRELRQIFATVVTINEERWEGRFFVAEVVIGQPQVREPDKVVELRFRSCPELCTLPSIESLFSGMACTMPAQLAKSAWSWETRETTWLERVDYS